MQATYVDHMGDDLRVVNAARVSFSKESEYIKGHDLIEFDEFKDWDDPELKEHLEYVIETPVFKGMPFEDMIPVGNKLKARDKKLIKYLATHNHWTPFSHAMITLREKVPIFVARQRFKHMVGFTYNEVSRRYVDDTPEFYEPEAWRSRPEGSVKQGSGNETLTKLRGSIDMSPWNHNTDNSWTVKQGSAKVGFYSIKKDYDIYLHAVKKLYNHLIEGGVAPEQARMVLPQSMYTEYYVTGSLAAWARAYKLRSDPHAQLEIQELAKQWDAIIQPLFPVSWKALTE